MLSLSYIIVICNLDGKTFKKPRRPYEKERLDAELKLVGEYGLRCKRELWRVQYALSRIRNAARMLLTLDEKDPRRIFEGEALLRRMNRHGLLDESQNKLDYVLALTVENFLERRLQTLVFKNGMAKSIHHARVLIRQRHIRVGRQVVNVPSFMVRVDSQKHIEFSLTSPFGGGRPGRVKQKRTKRLPPRRLVVVMEMKRMKNEHSYLAFACSTGSYNFLQLCGYIPSCSRKKCVDRKF
ncbi:unnamed protein product [Withania somnifera]